MMADEIDWVRDAKFIPEKGEIRILDSRVVIMNIDMFKSFRDDMLKIAGPVADHLIYIAAKDHAREYVNYVIEKSKIEKLVDKTEIEKEFIPEQISQILTQFGYGRLIPEKVTDEELVASINNSAIASQYENTEVPVCSHIAGLIAGGVTAIYGKEFDCEEVECLAKGDPVCRFVVRLKE